MSMSQVLRQYMVSWDRGFQLPPEQSGRCAMSSAFPSGQCIKQCSSLLEVSGVKPLGEPAVDRCEQVVGFGALALLLPEARQAHSGAQLQRFRLLAAGNVQGLLEAG